MARPEATTGGACAHQFDDPAQQTEAVHLGMWTFLLTEVMFFGGLFTGYTLYRGAHPVAFAEGSRHLDVVLGGVNTAVLIVSSFTMVRAVRAAEQRSRGRLIGHLCLTAVLGSTFLAIKGLEYAHKFEERLVPGPAFDRAAVGSAPVELFMSLYFGMTGLHALHMVIGILILVTLAVIVWRRPEVGPHANAVEMTGLYWHFVDVVWIFLFPLLYLIGSHA